MDATRPYLWLTLSLLALGGCADFASNTHPATRPQADGPQRLRDEPPQVVEGDATAAVQASDTEPKPQQELTTTIESWIARVDDAQARAAAREREQTAAGNTHLLADEAPADSQPTIRVIGPDNTDLTPTSQPTVNVTTQPIEATTAPAAPPAPEPPVLGSMTVQTANPLETQTAPPTGPGVNHAIVARTAVPTTLTDFLEQLPMPDDPGFRTQLDERVLWAVAGDYERARASLEFVTDEQQKLAAGFIDALIAIRNAHPGDLSAAAANAGTELDDLRDVLREVGDLRIPVVAICSAVRSFGQYDEINPARFVAGLQTEFVLYCEVADFVSERRNDKCFHTAFDMTTTILNRAGDTVVDYEDTDILDQCRNRRNDCFIPRLVRLPASLSPGRYVAKVTIVDKLGKKVAENRVDFELVARR